MSAAIPPPRPGRGRPGSPYRICFVCTGNICRSPMAAVVLESRARSTTVGGAGALAERLSVSSVGTGPWHVGEPMDPRARAALARSSYDGNSHVARQVDLDELSDADLVVCLDRRHLDTLRSLTRAGDLAERMVMLRRFDPGAGASTDVADPYYGEISDFEECLEVIEAACRGLVAELARSLEDPSSPAGPAGEGATR